MSLDPSLKAAAGLNRHRNVLTRAERMEKMLADGKATADDIDILGMPKVANRKLVVGKKTPKKTDDDDKKK